jgi:hypothetical protein
VTAPRGRYAELVAACKRRILVEALAQTRGSVREAAVLLDLTRSGFYALCRRLDVDPHYYRGGWDPPAGGSVSPGHRPPHDPVR